MAPVRGIRRSVVKVLLRYLLSLPIVFKVSVVSFLRAKPSVSRQPSQPVQRKYAEALQKQYCLMLSRLRKARFQAPCLEKRWWVTKEFIVEPVWLFQSVHWFMQKCIRQHVPEFCFYGLEPDAAANACNRIAAVITGCGYVLNFSNGNYKVVVCVFQIK
jgi:hypothetical protein